MGILERGDSKLCVVTEVWLSGLSPEHPIELPGEGGGGEGEGESFPHPSHPIYWPDPRPTHPIAPGGETPTHPIAPGGDLSDIPHPSHPIVIPPGEPLPPEVGEDLPFEVKVGWTEDTGWVVVLIPTGEHVTPSAA